MMDELHILEPPPRRALVAEVKLVDPGLLKRLKESKIVAHRVNASLVIFRVVSKWYEGVRYRKSIQAALQNVQRREDDLLRLFDDAGSLDGSYTDDGSVSMSMADSMSIGSHG